MYQVYPRIQGIESHVVCCDKKGDRSIWPPPSGSTLVCMNPALYELAVKELEKLEYAEGEAPRLLNLPSGQSKYAHHSINIALEALQDPNTMLIVENGYPESMTRTMLAYDNPPELDIKSYAPETVTPYWSGSGISARNQRRMDKKVKRRRLP